MAQFGRVEPPPLLNPVVAPASVPKRPRRARRFILPVLMLAGVCAATVYGLRRQAPAVRVQTGKVSRHTITETVVANGKVYPVREVHISPEVSGEIIALPVKEGQFIHQGDLLLKINPDVYIAALNQARAGYESSVAAKTTALANLEKAGADFSRNEKLFQRHLLSESDFIGFKVARDVARANVESAADQVAVAQASVDSAQDTLNRTTIVAPMDGTITTLSTQLGERVLGTIQNVGTDLMIISDLSAMEARVDIGEMDIIRLQTNQPVRLEVDSFTGRKFKGVVTAVGDSSEGFDSGSSPGLSAGSGSSGQSATQFQVRIRFTELAAFRPGMSVTATIETRTRTNVLAVPIASVTTRVIKPPAAGPAPSAARGAATNPPPAAGLADGNGKPVDVVFVAQGDQARAVPVTIGVSDDNFWEITTGLQAGQEIVIGGYQAISRDLDDGKTIARSAAPPASPPSSP